MKGIILSPVVSEPAYSGNSVRVKQMLASFQTLGADMSFVLFPMRGISNRKVGDVMKSAYGSNYYELNQGNIVKGIWQQAALDFGKKHFYVKTFNAIEDFMYEDGYVTAKVQKEFEAFVKKVQPDFIVVEYAILSKFIENIDPNIITIVDTHDRFAERNERIRSSGGTGTWFSLSIAQEKLLLERFDHVVAIQSNEGNSFKEYVDTNKTSVEVISILENAQRDNYINIQPNTIGFIGSANKHNSEGIALFLELHWLTIKLKVPDAKLCIAGADYPFLHHWKDHDVEFKGKVDSLAQFYDECSFIINPCLSGTGLKIKSVEALSYGKPLITTIEGAEGLEDSNNCGSFIYPLQSPLFGQLCIDLLCDTTQCKKIGTLATQYIQQAYQKTLHLLKSLVRF